MDSNDKKEGIVLKSTKYGDNSLIVNILTHDEGLQAYIIKGVHGNKKGSRAALLQNTNIINFVTTHSKLRSPIGQLKDIEISCFYKSIPNDMSKMATALFISELCAKTIAGQERNDMLYDFVKDSLLRLDKMDGSIANYPLCFIVGLSRMFGFAPLNNHTQNSYFDMTEGRFTRQAPDSHNYFFNIEKSCLLASFLTDDIYEPLSQHIGGDIRREMLDGLITYVRLHTPVMGSIQSHEILRQVLG